MLIIIIKSQPMDDKLSLKGTWSRHVTKKFLVPLKYPGMAKAKDFNFCTLVTNMNY